MNQSKAKQSKAKQSKAKQTMECWFRKNINFLIFTKVLNLKYVGVKQSKPWLNVVCCFSPA